MKLTHFLLLLSIWMPFIACKSSKENSQTKDKMDSKKYEQLAQEKFGKDTKIDYLFNQDKTFVICKTENKPKALEPYNNLKFFVYDIAKDEVLLQESFRSGTVQWTSNERVEASWVPGMVRKDQTNDDFRYTFDVKTKKKTKGKVSNK